jgi:hypothetical protein
MTSLHVANIILVTTQRCVRRVLSVTVYFFRFCLMSISNDSLQQVRRRFMYKMLFGSQHSQTWRRCETLRLFPANLTLLAQNMYVENTLY